MKRFTLLLVAGVAMSGCATLGPDSAEAIRNELRREVLAHHLNSPGFGGLFSVVADIDWAKRRFVELPPNDLLYVLQRCPMDRKIDRFIPVEYLRLPMSRWQARHADALAEQGKLQVHQGNLETQQRTLLDKLVKGVIPDHVYQEKSRELDADIAICKAQILDASLDELDIEGV
jgi:hypothetical protein